MRFLKKMKAELGMCPALHHKRFYLFWDARIASPEKLTVVFELFHQIGSDTSVGETAVVEKVLHSNHFGVIAE